MSKISLLEFAEKYCGQELNPWQKEVLEKLEASAKGDTVAHIYYPRSFGKNLNYKILKEHHDRVIKAIEKTTT